MKISRSRRIRAIGILFCSLFLMSCSKPSDDVEIVEGIKLNKGAIIENDGGNYSNYNYIKGKYEKVNNNEVIGLYEHNSDNYIAQKDGKYIVFYSGKIIELSNIEIGDDGLKMSPSGEYLSLYRNVDGVTTYKIIKLSNGEYVDFNTDTGISGHYLDWIDSNTLVYYGVNNEGVNGIFTYNLENGEEKLLYKLDGGIVQYLSTDSEGIVILQETINDEKVLQVINSKTSEVKTISKDITRLYDIVNVDGVYYALGEFNDGILSIYKLQDGKHYRLLFDFPSSIKATRYGLSVDEEGNILFIGSNSDPELEEVYSISKDGTIRKVSESKNEYTFVK